MRLRLDRSAILVCSLASLFFVACSGGTEDEDTAAGPEDTLSVEEVVEVTDGQAESSADVTSEPSKEVLEGLADDLNRALGWHLQDSQTLQNTVARELELALLREEEVSKCMKLEGFDYTAVDQSSSAQVIEDPTTPRGTAEFVERYGFGLTTLLFPTDLTEPEAVGYSRDWLSSRVPSSEQEDPNAVYFKSLDEPTQSAYRNALVDPGGCAESAFNTIRDSPQILAVELADEIKDIEERVKASAEYLALISEVDSCMEVSNFTFTGIDDMETSLFSGLTEAGVLPDNPHEEGETVTETFGSDPVDEDMLPHGSDEWQVALAQVQEREMLLAGEFARCIGGDEWRDRLNAVSQPFFADFAASNEKLRDLYDLSNS